MSFKPAGYVESAGGQVEAIITQENEVQVVHIGDHISGHYRVTKISPDSVEAIDEELVQAPTVRRDSRELTAAGVPDVAKPLTAGPTAGPAPVVTQAALQVGIAPPEQKPLGYVEQADGRIQTVVAEADTVRLETEPSAEAVAQAAPPAIPVGDIDTESPHKDDLTGETRDLSSGAQVKEASFSLPTVRSAPQLEPDPVRQQAVTPSSTDDPVSFMGDSLASEQGPAPPVVLMFPLGYVVRQDGEFAAIISQDDGIYIVGQGDRFAGRYRALSVTADTVEVIEDPPRQAHPPPLRAPPETPVGLTAGARDGPEFSAGGVCINCKFPASGEVSSKSGFEARNQVESPPSSGRNDSHGRNMPVKTATEASTGGGVYAFQRLGSVETANGETRAIVADGSDLYLAKPGEIFAGRYRAISVDSDFVLARRDTTVRRAGIVLSTQAVSSARNASKSVNGNLHFPLSELENLQALHPAPAPGTLNSGELRATPISFSLMGSLTGSLTGSGFEPESIAAGDLVFGY